MKSTTTCNIFDIQMVILHNHKEVKTFLYDADDDLPMCHTAAA